MAREERHRNSSSFLGKPSLKHLDDVEADLQWLMLNEQVQQLLGSQAKLLEARVDAATQQTDVQQGRQERCGSQLPQGVVVTLPEQQQQQQQQHSQAGPPASGGDSLLGTSMQDFELQLQQLQSQVDSMGGQGQPPSTTEQASLDAAAVSGCKGLQAARLSTRCSLTSAQQQQQQQQQLIDDQAATIADLKRVIAELELQTSVLRSQAARQSSAGQALTECQALLQQRQQQVEELQQQHELSQAAIRQAMRATAAAEAERDALSKMLQDAGAEQQAASKGQEAADQNEQLQQENEELVSLVALLRQERQHLLQRLLEANEQISDLHDEMGPALLRGSPTRNRPSSAAARASAAARVSWLLPSDGGDSGGWGSGAGSSHPGSSSGIGQQLSAAVGELSSKTQAVRAARSAAMAELQELHEAYAELQQQHGTLQAKHQLLQEEHSQLLNRQLGVTSDRGSLRQQFLSTEEQLQAAKKQVADLQEEVMEENFRLKLQLVEKGEALRRAAADAAGLQAGLASRAALHSLEAKNQVLLQEVTRLLAESSQLKQQLADAEPAGATAAAAAASSRSPFSSASGAENGSSVFGLTEAASRSQSLIESNSLKSGWSAQQLAADTAAAAAAGGATFSRSSSVFTGMAEPEADRGAMQACCAEVVEELEEGEIPQQTYCEDLDDDSISEAGWLVQLLARCAHLEQLLAAREQQLLCREQQLREEHA
ncbi:hypothetical protein OEZ86_014668 [Tetradesmus obliquus]|nr:hypothetical protein OEZ86_014668 [Tetradesmus obliquus]